MAQKSVDFVISDAGTLKPLVILELDESSHAIPERQTRDDEVGAILEVAGLPFVHCLPDWTYNTIAARLRDSSIAAHLVACSSATRRVERGVVGYNGDAKLIK